MKKRSKIFRPWSFLELLSRFELESRLHEITDFMEASRPRFKFKNCLRNFADEVSRFAEIPGSSESIGKSGQREIFCQAEVRKTQEYFVYFKFFEPKDWRKRSAARRRRSTQSFQLKKTLQSLSTLENFGAAIQIRTGDLILTKDALYLLSYSSISQTALIL